MQCEEIEGIHVQVFVSYTERKIELGGKVPHKNNIQEYGRYFACQVVKGPKQKLVRCETAGSVGGSSNPDNMDFV